MTAPIRHVKIAGPRGATSTPWSDPAFTNLPPETQLVYFYGRYRSTRGRLTFEGAKEAGLGLPRERFDAAVRQLEGSPHRHAIERRGRRYIAADVRRAVFDRDKTCRSCGADHDLSLDHIIPYSRGGPDTVDNLQVLCRPCNSRKGARL